MVSNSWLNNFQDCFFWDGIDNWDGGEWERGSGMTVTITATMDSLLLRLFLLCFHFKPFTNKKKLDYICLVAWFMFQMVMFLRRLNSYIFTQNNNYKGIGIVFSSANSWRKCHQEKCLQNKLQILIARVYNC